MLAPYDPEALQVDLTKENNDHFGRVITQNMGDMAVGERRKGARESSTRGGGEVRVVNASGSIIC